MDLSNSSKTELISKATVEEAQSKEPRRICFSVHQRGQPKRISDPNYVGTFNVPFGEGFSRVFPWQLFRNRHDRYHDDSVWRSIVNEEEFQQIQTWVENQGDRVFLRDCLSSSIALSLNFSDVSEKRRTEIGELEYRAKNRADRNALKNLALYSMNLIEGTPCYRKAEYIAAVPPHPEKRFDVPSEIVKMVCGKSQKITNITEHFHFGDKKLSAKSASLRDKWIMWEQANLSINCCLDGKDVILLDDKYQSGTTIQFVAMKLQEAGARGIFGLSLVKTMRDTDNQ